MNTIATYSIGTYPALVTAYLLPNRPSFAARCIFRNSETRSPRLGKLGYVKAITLLPVAALSALAFAAAYPEAQISNGILQAKLLLPDAQNGYYRGTRFDWSGAISSLQFKGHEYFGKWFDHYDPKIHDAIMGPVEEFLSNGTGLGYQEAKVGESFVKIGVGAVRKPEEADFQQFNTYEIASNGEWTLDKGGNFVAFTQTLPNTLGYAYVYKKVVRLTPGKPEMTLEHRPAEHRTGKLSRPASTSITSTCWTISRRAPTTQ